MDTKELNEKANSYARFAAEAQDGRYPEDYVRKEGERLRKAVIDADAQARRGLESFVTERQASAHRIRTSAEAGRDSQERIADELENQRLVASSQSGTALLAKASETLRGDEPRRAAMYMTAAETKGLTGEAVIAATDLKRAIEVILDEREPLRRRAVEVEREIARTVDAFQKERGRVLANAGIGIGKDGSVDFGRQAEARLEVSRQMAKLR